MTKKSKKTVKNLQTADMRPNRDYYCPALEMTIQAASPQELQEKIDAEKERRAALKRKASLKKSE